jgi:hypothetical protein
MDKKTIRSGPDIVKEFVCSLLEAPSLDKDTVEVIAHLYNEDKLSLAKLQQALELKRNT